MLVPLDGYVETEEGSLARSFPDDRLHSFLNDQSRTVRAFPCTGRRLYELMAEHWPRVQGPGTP